MHKLLLRVQFHVSQLRKAYTVCILLLLITLVIYFALIKAEQRNLKAQALQMQKMAEQTRTADFLPQVLQPRAIEHEFYTALPSSSNLKLILEKLFDLAVQKNLMIDTVSYQLQQDAKVSFATYNIDLPTSGKYLDIMKFVYSLMLENSTLSLKNIIINRDDTNNNDVNANIQFSLYVKKQ